MKRTRFQFILQNFHFSDSNNEDITDKSYKIRPIIEQSILLKVRFKVLTSTYASLKVDEYETIHKEQTD